MAGRGAKEPRKGLVPCGVQGCGLRTPRAESRLFGLATGKYRHWTPGDRAEGNEVEARLQGPKRVGSLSDSLLWLPSALPGCLEDGTGKGDR